MTKRRIVAAIADLHSGHLGGMLNPDTVLWREDECGEIVPWYPALTETQRYIWRCAEQDRQRTINLAAGDKIVLFVCGDLTQGTQYQEHLVSTRLADHIEIAFNNLLPWVSLPDVRKVRIIKGTGSHVFGEGSAEMIVCRMLQERYRRKDIKVLYHSLAGVDGVRFDVSHHGPFPGSREWLRGNVARYYLRDLMMREIMALREPPKVVLRAHYHTWVHEYLEIEAHAQLFASHLVIVPPYCAVGDYARKATRSIAVQTQGMAAFEIVDRQLVGIHPFKRTVDLRTEEAL